MDRADSNVPFVALTMMCRTVYSIQRDGDETIDHQLSNDRIRNKKQIRKLRRLCLLKSSRSFGIQTGNAQKESSRMQNAYTTAPPPSYALESSSGESDWDDLASPARSELKPIKELARDATVETRGGENMTRAGRMVCLVGYTGERIVKEVMNPSREEQTTTAASVYVDGVQVCLLCCLRCVADGYR